jgi:uncharacterized RDD family membrane protein YckC
LVRTEGALAAKSEFSARPSMAAPPPRRPLVRGIQQSLFPERQSNVVQFSEYAAQKPTPPKPTSKAPAKPRAGGRRRSAPAGQASLDFLPPQPATPRTLSTTVEAVVSCDSPVATTPHRAIAAAIDWSVAVIGYLIFLTVYFGLGGQFSFNRLNLMVFTGALLIVGFCYGLTWTLLGVDSAGMRWMGLRLTTVDGFPPERKHRWMRFAASCLSFCTVLGQLWCLADEESLTWQDHISGTFPTPRRGQAPVFRRA